jgi:hypothetical protein
MARVERTRVLGRMNGGVDFDASTGAGDDSADRECGAQRGGRRSECRGVAQGELGVIVDSGDGQCSGRLHLIGEAEDGGDERHRIDASVEERAAAELGVEEAVGQVGRGDEAEVRADEGDVAERPAVE